MSYISRLHLLYKIMFLGVENQIILLKAIHLNNNVIIERSKIIDKKLINILTEIKQNTTYYIWHTRGDDKVRPSHVANNGKIFSWEDPPLTGHPGEEYGCRCWSEPYIYDPPIQQVYPIENLLFGLFGVRAIALVSRILQKIGQKEPKVNDNLTLHGAQRASQRNITYRQAVEAMESAKKRGSVVIKYGKYGTRQEHYIGNNGITVVKETTGRNAGKIITMWRR